MSMKLLLQIDLASPSITLWHQACQDMAFSSAPVDPGFGLEQMAATLNDLMIQLGYSKYVAQGMRS